MPPDRTAGHTPTPWAVFPGFGSEYVVPASHLGRSMGGASDPDQDARRYAHPICRMPRPGSRYAQATIEANAALIVRAVNVHEDLTDALAALLEDVLAINGNEELLRLANRVGWGDRVTASIQRAEAALALARGKEAAHAS